MKSLEQLFFPESICVIAGAVKADSPARRPLVHLLKHGFKGRLYGVNPTGDVPEGVIHVPTVAELPEVPSLALIVLGAKDTPAAIEACGKRGIRTAIVITSGFEEIEGGKAYSRQLVEATRHGCATIVGPNSEGVWTIPGLAVLSHGSAARRERLVPGPVSVLSQSGSIGAATISRIQDWGIGCRFFVSVGNETLVNMLDYLEYIIEEGGTRVCALFVEGLVDARRLRGLLVKARAKNMRIVALKGGITLEGRTATQSHTGKMSSPGEIYSSVFRQFGILEAQSLMEFFDLVAIAAQDNHAETLQSTPGVGIVAFSGGCRALIVDRLVAYGLPIARFADPTEQALSDLLPSFAYVKNPVDPSNVILRNPHLLMSVVKPILADPAVGAFILQYPNWSEDQIREHIGHQLDTLAQLMHEHRKPVVVSLLGMDFSKEFRAEFVRRGIALSRDPADAARYMQCLREAGRRSEALAAPLVPPPSDGISDGVDSLAGQMRLLERIGIPVPGYRIVSSEGELDAALGGLRYPLAVKTAAPEVLHKTDTGLVHLGIANREEAREAWKAIRAINAGPVLFQEMAQGVEVFLSASRDPDFGEVLCIARGGVLVEQEQVKSYLACPAHPQEVRDALERARLMPLLSGLRGRKAADVEALVEAVCRLGAFFAANRTLEVIELNPVIVGPKGEGVRAVDVVTIGIGNNADRNAGALQ